MKLMIESMGFDIADVFDGHWVRILTIVDAFSRLSPAVYVRMHYQGVSSRPTVS